MSPWLLLGKSYARLARSRLPRHTPNVFFCYRQRFQPTFATRLFSTQFIRNPALAPDRTPDALSNFLVNKLLHPSADLSDASTFRALYLSSRSAGRNDQLSPEHLSLLISFYGTLSLPVSHSDVLAEPPDKHDTIDPFGPNPLAQKLQGGNRDIMDMSWPFVVIVAKDKRELGYQLNDGDNFWLMHAALQNVRRLIESGTGNEKAVVDHLDRARTHYFNIRSHHPWRTHHAYVDALLSFTHELPYSISSKLGSEAAGRLATLIKWRLDLHPRLLELIWRVLLLPAESVSDKAKEKFVGVLQRQLEKETARIRQTFNSPVLKLDSMDFEDATEYSAQTVQDQFIRLLFSPIATTSTKGFLDARYWILWQAQLGLASFGATAEAKKRSVMAWSNLRLLALSLWTNRTGVVEGADASEIGLTTATTPGWTVICSLSAIERVIADVDVGEDRENIQQLIQNLWILWRRETENALSFSMMNAFTNPTPISEAYISGGSHLPRAEVPTSVLCAISSSFLRLAARIEDVRLHRAVLRHVERVIMDPALLVDHTVSNGALRAVAVQTCIAGTVLSERYTLGAEYQQWSWDSVLGHMYSERLLPRFRDAKDSVAWVNAVANNVLRELVDYSIQGVYHLYMTSKEAGIELAGDTIKHLGRAFTSTENHELAVLCIRDARLSSDSAQLLFDMTLRNIAHSRGNFTDLRLVRSVIGILTSVRLDGQVLFPSKGKDVERLVALSMRSGHVDEAAQIVRAVRKLESTRDGKLALLRPIFVQRFVRSLLSSRRYRLLTQMLTIQSSPEGFPRPSSNAGYMDLVLKHPQLRFVRRLVSAASLQSADPPLRVRVNNRLVRRSIPFSRYDWRTLSRFVRFRPQLPMEDKRVISLKLSAAMRSLKNSSGSRVHTEIDERTLEDIASILIRVGRVCAALKILDTYSEKTKDGKPSISTRAGNIILSASLLPRRSRRNIRQFRHAARRLQELVSEHGFVPDRVTLNILMKALLRWQHLTPPDTLRELFDKLVRSGYPHAGLSNPQSLGFFDSAAIPASSVSPGTQDEKGRDVDVDVLTIRTSATSKENTVQKRHRLNIPLSAFSAYSRKLSFDMHVRPLYKMFIKAFYARGDKEAARQVLESLRILQSNNLRERTGQQRGSK